MFFILTNVTNEINMFTRTVNYVSGRITVVVLYVENTHISFVYFTTKSLNYILYCNHLITKSCGKVIHLVAEFMKQTFMIHPQSVHTIFFVL